MRLTAGAVLITAVLPGLFAGWHPAAGQGVVAPEVVFQSEVLERTPGQPNQHRMPFETCDPNGTYWLVVDNGVGGSPRVSSGRVLLNGAVVVTEADLNQQVARVSRPVVLQGANVLELRMAGGPGGRLRLTVNGYRRCLKVRITAPPGGALLRELAVVVQGEVEGTGVAGVRLDVVLPIRGNLLEVPVPTEVSRGRFAAWVPLAPGGVQITARATDEVGRAAEDRVLVTVQPDPMAGDRPVRLEASPTVGFAPHEVIFVGREATDPDVDRLDLDVDGDGVPDYGLADFRAAPHQVTHTYTEEGLYIATMRVRYAPTGRVLVASVPISVIGVPDLAALWGAFVAALARGDRDAVLRLIATEARERYGRVLDDLAADLGGLAAELQGFTPGTVRPGYATGSVVRVRGGVTEAFLVSFVRDVDGVWRIAGL